MSPATLQSILHTGARVIAWKKYKQMQKLIILTIYSKAIYYVNVVT